VACALLACACDGTQVQIDGTVRGSALRLSHAISTRTSNVQAVLFTEGSLTCDEMRRGTFCDGRPILAVGVFVRGALGRPGDLVPSAPGKFAIVGPPFPDGNDAVATYGSLDSTCHATASETITAVSGSVTLDQLSPAAGKFLLTMSTGDELSGRFDHATVCP